MTEPTEEEVEVVARVIYQECAGTDPDFRPWVKLPKGHAATWRGFARAAILALDEHRAAEAPKHKDDF